MDAVDKSVSVIMLISREREPTCAAKGCDPRAIARERGMQHSKVRSQVGSRVGSRAGKAEARHLGMVQATLVVALVV